MKLTPVLACVVTLVGGVVLGYCGAVQHVSPAVERWVHRGDSLELAIQIRDAESVQRDAEVARYRLLVDSLAAQAKPLPPQRPTLPPAAPNVGTASDSAAYWRSDATRARAEVDSLTIDMQRMRQEAARRSAQLTATAHLLALSVASDSLHLAERDSLRALVKSAPQGRPHGISLFGVRLCPAWGIGYGATVSGGVVRAGPVAAVIQPLSCG